MRERRVTVICENVAGTGLLGEGEHVGSMVMHEWGLNRKIWCM
jgi:hypothetical protein